ncbi:hypothetical protein [Aphanothece sacrum]|uniref:PcfJ-like family protein n=1 Tax=Aphanothece sacrum FPU1 TaxID=1920663 RepID=A0A401IL22_APHSA|nr:hypothetical protein [Aphanothece sacrum]GBF81945.1 pcfJ-like family protein [Aphanothece sacrum FPU1]GBF83574.1 PcfJ-like family protein [Aphanothece sacrum FPU3]
MHENPLKRKIKDLTPGEQDAIKSLLDTLGIENTLIYSNTPKQIIYEGWITNNDK